MNKIKYPVALLVSLVIRPNHVLADPAPVSTATNPASTAGHKFSDSKYAWCKIAIVNMSIISSRSVFMQKINSILTKKREDLQLKIDSFQKEVAEKSKKFQSTLSSLSPQKQQQKREALAKEVGAKEAALQKEQSEIEQFQRSMMTEIIRQLKLIIAQLGEKHDCQSVLDSEAMLYYNKENCIDLTEDAIALLNSIKTDDLPLQSLEKQSR